MTYESLDWPEQRPTETTKCRLCSRQREGEGQLLITHSGQWWVCRRCIEALVYAHQTRHYEE